MPSTAPADRPSELTEGSPSVLLRMMEETQSEGIHSGVAPSHWIAAANYVHDYIMMRGTKQEDVAEEYGCGIATVSRLYRRIVASHALDYVYGVNLVLETTIASTLSERRATAGMFAVRLGETEKVARRRLRSAEHNSNFRSEDFGGKTFYWEA